MKSQIKRLCVFSGSSPGNRVEYTEAATQLGLELVKHNIDLVYGGGNVGLMGIIADSVMSAGGEVIGVIPEFLANKEVAHTEITDLRVVQSMHERKALMSEMSDGFIALPGGLGTFEELFEVLTWQQLGIQSKPCALLNSCGYFDHLLKMLDHAVTEKFVKQVHRDMLLTGDSAELLIDLLMNYEHSHTDKWIDKVNIVDSDNVI
jgi:uncharacterized protein (TIGR00730 family)